MLKGLALALLVGLCVAGCSARAAETQASPSPSPSSTPKPKPVKAVVYSADQKNVIAKYGKRCSENHFNGLAAWYYCSAPDKINHVFLFNGGKRYGTDWVLADHPEKTADEYEQSLAVVANPYSTVDLRKTNYATADATADTEVAPTPTPVPQPVERHIEPLRVGYVGTVATNGGDGFLCWDSSERLDEVYKAAAANDKEGFADLAASHAIHLHAGDRVRVIDSKGWMGAYYKLRLISGDDYNSTCWVQTEGAAAIKDLRKDD